MKFLSQVYASVSGSIGGITYSHNRGGLYTRTRTIPTNPATAFQGFVRNGFSQLVARWSQVLTAAQRTEWNLYASNVPVIDTLGQSIYLSGFNMYIRSNLPRVQYNNIVPGTFTIVDDGPTIFTLGETDPVANLVSISGANPSLAFDDTLDWVNEDEAGLLVFIGRPVSPTINFFKGPYRVAQSVLGDSVTPPTTPASLGALYSYTAGQRCFARCRITRADGRLSPSFDLEPIAAT
jgi:hypothetical protein